MPVRNVRGMEDFMKGKPMSMLMEKPVFSIIIPVYNAEKYIRKSIESVIKQGFGDWQLLLIDDCSTDQSLVICREYEKKDDRIKVLPLKSNQGASQARNKGIEAADGVYITFMDSDDYIETNVLTNVYYVLELHPAKLTVIGAIEEYYDSKGVLTDEIEIMPIGSQDEKAIEYAAAGNHTDSMKVLFLKEQQSLRRHIIELEKSTLYGYLWNKYYDADYLKQTGLKMETLPLLEDAKFNILYSMDIDTMNLINIAAYHYCKRAEDSLTSKYVKDYFKIHRDHINMLFSQQITWGNTDSRTRGVLADIYGRYIISALLRNCDKRAGMSYKDRKAWLKSVLKDNLFNELIPYGNGNGTLNRTLMLVLRSKITWLGLAAGRVIYIIKSKFPKLFAAARKKH